MDQCLQLNKSKFTTFSSLKDQWINFLDEIVYGIFLPDKSGLQTYFTLTIAPVIYIMNNQMIGGDKTSKLKGTEFFMTGFKKKQTSKLNGTSFFMLQVFLK